VNITEVLEITIDLCAISLGDYLYEYLQGFSLLFLFANILLISDY